MCRRGSRRHNVMSRRRWHGTAIRQSESSELHLTFVLAFAYLMYSRGSELIPLLALPRCTSLPAAATTSTDACKTCRAHCKQTLHYFNASSQRATVGPLWENKKGKRHNISVKTPPVISQYSDRTRAEHSRHKQCQHELAEMRFY